MAAQVGGREQRTKTARAGMVVWEVAGERVRHAHPDCDRESIRWRNGATAYKGNKEPRRRGIFICPSTHSEGRHFIMDRHGIAFFFSLLNGAACVGVGVEWAVWFCGDSSPTLPSHRDKKTKWKTYYVRPENFAVTPWSPPMGRGTAKITPLPGPN